VVSGAGSGLLGSRSTLLPLAVSFAVLLPHWDLLRVRLRVAGPVLFKLSVEVGQLFVKLAHGLDKFVEARSALGVGGVMVCSRLRVVRAARV
jgi:hypothetical protein